MVIEKIYFKRNDNQPCDILDVMNILSNCSKLEKSAISSKAEFGGEIENGLALLSYDPNFFVIKKDNFLPDILSAGYQTV